MSACSVAYLAEGQLVAYSIATEAEAEASGRSNECSDARDVPLFPLGIAICEEIADETHCVGPRCHE